MDLTTEFSSGYTFANYHAVRPKLDKADGKTAEWAEVLDALHQRVAERFLDPIRDLERFDAEAVMKSATEHDKADTGPAQ